MTHILEREQLVRRPRPEVFAFFADAANLARLTPKSLRFKIAGPPPIDMRAGTLIDYQIAVLGVGLRWRTLIEEFQSGSHFVDVQLRGPYRSWRHLHQFEDSPGGTLVRDRVEYELPLGILGEIAWALFVERQLRGIFDFRRIAIDDLLGVRRVSVPAAGSTAPS